MPIENRKGSGRQFEIWAGLECTVNRVGDRYFNQCDRSGHLSRKEDLDLFAGLGIKKIRYPFLWELAAPETPENIDWSWIEDRVSLLRQKNLSPIVGFVHHGSGPRYTNLLDPQFPEKLAKFAGEFARNFPWIQDYTPINEPLTTARFSGLYGVWYPHHKSDRSFVRALANQIKGIILSMKAIRDVVPQARLIQTEDMGRICSTDVLKYQAKFENERRWLSFDLLSGRVDEEHFMYDYLIENGLGSQELQWFQENPVSADVIGINHYLLSNRFLDHRLEHYPETFHGGNGKHAYADVGAIDTSAARYISPEEILSEVWDRYQSPIAVTEAHLFGPREAQVRWLNQVYQGALNLENRGVKIEAVTAWSLLGSYDWNSLCTVEKGFYESGVFDLRAPAPRPTALAKMIQNWNGVSKFENPLAADPGWWMDPSRSLYGPRSSDSDVSLYPKPRSQSRCVLITGANGTLGRAFARICEARNISYRSLSRAEMNIANFKNVQQVISEIKPWAVINTAGYVRVDQAEEEKDRCFQENVMGPQNLSVMCERLDIPLVHFSSDLVFDGLRAEPYLESHPVSPLNTYGHTKAESEKILLATHEKSLILRTSSFFGPWDQASFLHAVLQSLFKKESFLAANDITVSPTYVPDLVDATLDLLIDGETGIIHLTNEGQLTWADWAHKIAEKIKKETHHIIALPAHEMKFLAKRPAFSALKSERIRILPTFEEALDRFFFDLKMNTEKLPIKEGLNL